MTRQPIFSSSAADENSRTFSGADDVASLIVIEVVDEGSWSGSITVGARAVGRGTGAFSPIAVKNRSDESTIGGATGITAAGIYEINTAGLEVQFQHDWSAGAVSVYGTPILG